MYGKCFLQERENHGSPSMRIQHKKRNQTNVEIMQSNTRIINYRFASYLMALPLFNSDLNKGNYNL
ncbi:hypothetical protein ACS0TY_019047 [Phlomoides rotata]